jgi:hypothetical protein
VAVAVETNQELLPLMELITLVAVEEAAQVIQTQAQAVQVL